jgi:hypothetical protein
MQRRKREGLIIIIGTKKSADKIALAFPLKMLYVVLGTMGTY